MLTFKQNVKFAKLLRIAAPVGVLVAVAACVLEIVVHYTSKVSPSLVPRLSR